MEHSKACCAIKPAKAEYENEGGFIQVQGMKTYRSGPSTATKAILLIFDIFAFSPQTLQGADILASGLTAANSNQYQVFVPDFLDGAVPDHSWFPMDTPDKEAKLGGFIEGPANVKRAVGRVDAVLKELNEKSGDVIADWAILGMCWGGKIVSLVSGLQSPFRVGAEVHPSFVNPEDAKAIDIPLCMLASKDEDAQAIAEFKNNLKVPNYVETFDKSVHGWMAARANLSEQSERAEYERGYAQVLSFFQEHI